jgi:hypothetical protein
MIMDLRVFALNPSAATPPSKTSSPPPAKFAEMHALSPLSMQLPR